MDLIMPQFGLFFWTLVIFLTFFFLMKKYAWKPILKAIKEREDKIEKSLLSAQEAEKKMQELHSSNEKLLAEAVSEKEKIRRTAQEVAAKLIEEAKTKAKEEYAHILDSAKEAINTEKMAAMTELKNQVGLISIEIAEKVLKRKLASADIQKELIDQYVGEINKN
ncbi:MAG: ATP synthase F0 subunit B [Bacteroidetes bacterium RIFCSPLOWO2_02_FULL_36_8]|nr:MAG: ATP synthase F0 subunit B [Bacteroidetes bacterium RIFCSPLOWO2_02_FULL_36_8]OFY69552.1 MAG: ATP synthase F0 subunit B [Bacteroidetes bacterium RIFCSPLOWO2_12_FULL_37_12]